MQGPRMTRRTTLRKTVMMQDGAMGLPFGSTNQSLDIFLKTGMEQHTDPYSEKPRANLFNVFKKLRENSVSQLSLADFFVFFGGYH